MPRRSTFRLPNKVKFQQTLLGWFAEYRRDLPWRHTSDPYHILVSEMMLQQTQVERVTPKYAEWLDRIPDVGGVGGRRYRGGAGHLERVGV